MSNELNGLTVPKTLTEAIRYYSDETRCLEILVATRWPDGIVTCPYCGVGPCHFMASVSRWQCKNKPCRKQFSIKVGTYMEDSPLSLDKWLAAMWFVTNAKNGISSCEVARSLGITQKSAWFMMHRIRLSFGHGQATDMNGTIEADETYLGGREENKHKNKKSGASGRRAGDKAIVYGLLERGDGVKTSRARASVVPNASRAELQGPIKDHVAPGSEVFTDQWPAYKKMPAEFVHQYVDHSMEYVNGMVHTNGMENFFSLLKRMVKGTYVAISPWHLQRYVEEQTFRFNERGGDDGQRFVKTVAGVHGKRLDYKTLTSPRWAFEDVWENN